MVTDPDEVAFSLPTAQEMGGTFRFGPMLGVLTEPLAILPALAGEGGGSNYLQDTYGDFQSGIFGPGGVGNR